MPQLDIVKEFFVVHTPEVAHPNKKNAVPLSEASLEVNHLVQSDIPEREFQVIDELPVIKTVNSGTKRMLIRVIHLPWWCRIQIIMENHPSRDPV